MYTEENNKKIEILLQVINKYSGFNILKRPTLRERRLTDARSVFMYIARNNTDLTLSDIGSLWKTKDYKGKDHSTVMHQERRIQNLLDIKDADVVKFYNDTLKIYKIRVTREIHKKITIAKYRGFHLHSRISARGKINKGYYV